MWLFLIYSIVVRRSLTGRPALDLERFDQYRIFVEKGTSFQIVVV